MFFFFTSISAVFGMHSNSTRVFFNPLAIYLTKSEGLSNRIDCLSFEINIHINITDKIMIGKQINAFFIVTGINKDEKMDKRNKITD